MAISNRNKRGVKKTKIVATIGPASESPAMIQRLAFAGMNVARLNFSHGDHAAHKKQIDTIRAFTKEHGNPIAILQDLAGPKIRTGEFNKERVTVKEGNTFTFTTKKCTGDEHKVYVNYSRLPKEVKKGGRILVDDGKKCFGVIRTTPDSVVCKVIVGGELKGRRGVNIPGAELSIRSITAKDKKDIAFGAKEDVDFVALSFVRRASDITELRRLLKKHGSCAHVIAKIETSEAVSRIDEILNEADGAMVARGDLAIEIPAADVPIVQKSIIHKCNILGKPVITATQMLESMVTSAVPTRAEVSDVANSILDGTDGIMLSEESALGKYPEAAVRTMFDIALNIENRCTQGERVMAYVHNGIIKDVVDSVSSAAVQTAEDVGARVIVALTESGFTGRMVSRFKPNQPILVVSPYIETVRKVVLSFGCYPMVMDPFTDFENTLDIIRQKVQETRLAKKGDKVVIAAGIPFGKLGGTNTVTVLEV